MKSRPIRTRYAMPLRDSPSFSSCCVVMLPCCLNAVAAIKRSITSATAAIATRGVGRFVPWPHIRPAPCGGAGSGSHYLTVARVAAPRQRLHRDLTYPQSLWPRVDPLHREDRGAEGDLRDGPPVRGRADPPERRALRPRGRVPRADRRADEGARAVRGDDPRGVRRDGAGPDDVRDDRRGAVAGLDLASPGSSTRTSSARTC